jgi:hypothetical protein
MLNRRFPYLLLSWLAVAACKDTNEPLPLVTIAGNDQSAPANTLLPQAIQITLRQADGTPVAAGQTVTFSILEGGGSLFGAPTAQTDASGTVTAPGWRLGKSNVPQKMRATLGATVVDIDAKIATQYNIEVRYFGDPMTPANQALFENAAARIEAIVTGDVTDASSSNTNLSVDCGPPGSPVAGLPTQVSEPVDDIIIYAAITSIDGANGTLAQAAPCIGRPNSPSGRTMVAYGFMKFDAADFSNLASGGNIQEVITHEMLHVLGSGTLWSVDRTLLAGEGSSDPRFMGPLARQACAGFGATVTCATSVPLETAGGPGTRDFHWRESVFFNELMTGFLNIGTNPLSVMTIASMADLDFAVNMAGADVYAFTGNSQAGVSLVAAVVSRDWEQVGPLRGMLLPGGRVQRIMPK